MSTTLTASGALSYSWSPSTGLSASNTATVTATPLTTTAYIVTGTATTTGCINTATVTVTVAIINPGTIATSQINCGAFTPATLTSTEDASGASPITYAWQSSTTADFSSDVTIIAGATATAYAPGSISTTTYYRRIAT